MSKIIITDGQTDDVLDWIPKQDVVVGLEEKDKPTTIERYDFETLADRRYAKHLKGKNRIIIPDEDGGYSEYVIFNVEIKTHDGVRLIYVNTMASFIEIKGNKTIEPHKTASQTAEAHVRSIVAGTELQVGTVDYTGLKTITYENKTDPYIALKSLATQFDLELRFRVEVDYNRVTRRYVDLIDRIGEWRGRLVEFGRDLIGVRRIEDTDNIVTALRVYGPEREDGTRLEVLVEDMDALRRWGRNGNHIIDVYEPESSDQDMTLDRLTTLGRTELNKRINAIVSYEIDFANTEHVPGMENKKVRYGDTIRIKDTKFEPPLYVEARVFNQKRDPFDESNKQVILGDYVEYTVEEVKAIWKELEDEINRKIERAKVGINLGIEAKSIKVYKNILDADKQSMDKRYDDVYHNPALIGTVKNQLSTAKADYDSTADSLLGLINAVGDEASEDDKQAVDAEYDAYKVKYATLAQAFEQATDAIGTKKDDDIISYTDGKLREANEIIDQAERDLRDAEGRIDIAEGRIDDADGKIEDALGKIGSLRDDLAGMDERKVDLIDYDARIGELVDDIADKVDGEWVDGRLQVELDGLEYEGRNLIKNSGNFTDNGGWSGATVEIVDGFSVLKGTGTGTITNTTDIPLEPNQEYVVTMEIKLDFEFDATNIVPNHLYVRYAGESANSALDGSYELVGGNRTLEANKWHRLSIKFKTKSDATKTPMLKYHVYTSGISGVRMLKSIKLDKGTKATPWSPAPEDIFADIDLKANADNVYVKADIDGMFDNTVSIDTYQFDQDGIVQRFLSNENNIYQNELAIGGKVEQIDYDADQYTLENRLTEWERTADGFEQSVTRLQTDLDDLEIGGSNLAINTDFSQVENIDKWVSLGNVQTKTQVELGNYTFMRLNANSVVTGDSLRARSAYSIRLEKGNKYTLSWLGIASTRANKDFNSTGVLVNGLSSPSLNSLITKEKVADIEAFGFMQVLYKYKATFTFNGESDSDVAIMIGSRVIGDGSAWVAYTEPQLEKGIKATDYSPSYGDVTEYTRTQIKQLSDSIDLNYVRNGELKAGIRIGEPRIGGYDIEVTGDTLFSGRISAPTATFLDLTTERMTAIDAIIEDATITGRVDGNLATILDLTTERMYSKDATMERGTILDATLQDVTITGEFIGGTIDIATDARLGSNLYIGQGGVESQGRTKGILFHFEDSGTGNIFQNSEAYIRSYVNRDGADLWLRATNQLMFQAPNIEFFGTNVIEFVNEEDENFGVSSIDMTGGSARWKQSDENYIWQQTNGNVSIYANAAVRHSFGNNGNYTSQGNITANGSLYFGGTQGRMWSTANYTNMGISGQHYIRINNNTGQISIMINGVAVHHFNAN